jgi:hypothetical protein
MASDDYGAGCPDTGNGCLNLYAVSIPGVTPSRFITWFQATAAARNAGKGLPTNAEWQAAALGTPDGAPCILGGLGGPGPTGTAGCDSDVGAFDLVGNLNEWVADWVPLAPGSCGDDLFPATGDSNCLAGANQAAGTAALVRGGNFFNGTTAGVFAVDGASRRRTRAPALGSAPPARHGASHLAKEDTMRPHRIGTWALSLLVAVGLFGMSGGAWGQSPQKFRWSLPRRLPRRSAPARKWRTWSSCLERQTRS